MLFADKYIQLGSIERAAIAAGYSPKYAKTGACKLLENVSVKEYITIRMNDLQGPTIASEREVLEYLTSVMRGQEKDQFGLDAPLSERTRAGELLGKRYGSFSDKFKRDIEERKLKILETRGGIGDENEEPVEIIDDIKVDE